MKQTLFLWGMALALMTGSASATSLSVAADPTTVHVGDTFTWDVRVAEATDLYGFQFDVAFDPAIVQANAVLEGTFLTAGGQATSFVPGAIDNIAGTVSFTANTLLGPGAGVTGDGVVVHLVFQALALGRSDLVFGNVVLLDSALAELATTPISGGVNVASVPEPASGALLGMGAAVLAAVARRRSR